MTNKNPWGRFDLHEGYSGSMYLFWDTYGDFGVAYSRGGSFPMRRKVRGHGDFDRFDPCTRYAFWFPRSNQCLAFLFVEVLSGNEEAIYEWRASL